ncbi:MAG TPA: alpha/beta fold hydrolase [Candidatus Stackebrandtia excrementipullorum]|nr:alpha/beta fold hydrolase [Candidatus Stackebrandtia excrementipullorum]
MAEQGTWLVELTGDGQPVYVFPHGGAGSGAVRDLAAALEGDARVVAVRLPGRESSAHLTCEVDTDVIAATLAAQIHADLGDTTTPPILYGHCAGAIFAYETAALLAADHHGALVISSHESPDRIPRPGVWTWDDVPFLERVAADGFLPPEVIEDEELREICLPPLRADYQAIETHESLCEVLPWPITALLADTDTPVAEDDITSWADVTDAGFTLRHVAGPHHLLTESTDSVASCLRVLLSEAAATGITGQGRA